MTYWFVSYFINSGNHNVFGDVTVSSDTDYLPINELRKTLIKKYSYDEGNVMIISFQQISKECFDEATVKE